MGNSNFYTKGMLDEVVSRINQVHTITIFCPIKDFCVQVLRNSFDVMLPRYKKSEMLWKDVPAVDALRVFLFTSSFFNSPGDNINKDIFAVIVSSLKMFKKLKKINFEFTLDENIENIYQKVIRKEKVGLKECIYKVELLEFNLADMFSQQIIDLLNKVFICNGWISNLYWERTFKIDVSFDDYVSFMEMFVNNNRVNFDSLDAKICDYITVFPALVKDHKPNIRIITNYSDEVTK